MLELFFYGLPLLGAFVYGLLKPGCEWMSDWTIFFAGAMTQVRSQRTICRKPISDCELHVSILPRDHLEPGLHSLFLNIFVLTGKPFILVIKAV